MLPDSLASFRNVSRFYGDKLIFRNLDLDALPGKIYLILGANGAGKSTLLRLAAGLARPDAGKISRRDKLRIAYLGHATFLYPALTALQNLRFWAKVHRLSNNDAGLMDLLAKAGLEAHAHERAGIFSRGMAQRLNFARCLMLEPELLLMDEPFTGMDEHSRTALRIELSKRRDLGACVMLVSHSPEADGKIADAILTIEKHRLVQKTAPVC